MQRCAAEGVGHTHLIVATTILDQLDCSESSDRGPPGVAESCWSSGWQVSRKIRSRRRVIDGPIYKRDGSVYPGRE